MIQRKLASILVHAPLCTCILYPLCKRTHHPLEGFKSKENQIPISEWKFSAPTPCPYTSCPLTKLHHV
uniref:Uncharacterized protein n=1 Tax=Gossypium raimondii TaxID=29730 RepID=A0A0D2TL34_GOSRA|nr:hypothetical protein B456_007G249700 [Gossypium raimondii]